MRPAALGQEMSGQVALVQALHDDDDDAGALVVEPARVGLVEPVERALALGLAQRLARIVRVVDDQHVGALAGRRAADRGGDAVAPRGGLELVLLVLVGGEAQAREDAPVPRCCDHQPAILRVLDAECARVARRHDARRRVVAQEPGRPGDRDTDRLQVAGRHVDDEPRDLAARAGLEVLADQAHMPVLQVRGGRIDGVERLGCEAREVLAQHGVEQHGVVDRGTVDRRIERGGVAEAGGRGYIADAGGRLAAVAVLAWISGRHSGA